MTRSNLEIESGGFPIYPADKASAKKWNSQRRASSLVQISRPPIMDKASVLFETGEHWEDKPCSCYVCDKLNLKTGTCYIHGPRIKTARFIADGIEYWPVCGKSQYGEPNKEEAKYSGHLDDPDYTGLGFVNAPEIGLEYSGVNCGGMNKGDDCDFYDTKGTIAKWDAPTGTCRVLKTEVANNDRCAAWIDDDWIDWRKGQQLIEKHGRSDGR